MKMPKENIDTNMFAPCGMNCLVCYKHCYHKKPCADCLNNDKGKPEHCRKCKIKDCIKIKGLSYCFECSDYPCKLIKSLEKSYNKRYQASLMENSEFVRQEGCRVDGIKTVYCYIIFPQSISVQTFLFFFHEIMKTGLQCANKVLDKLTN